MVQDPNKKPSRKDVEAMFERVRRAGAQEGPVPEPARPAAARSSLFSGSSHTLSGETRQQEQATSETPASPPDPIVHNVVFWRNGFTVNGGPLRRLDDPLNLPFLEVRVPPDLDFFTLVPIERFANSGFGLVHFTQSYIEYSRE